MIKLGGGNFGGNFRNPKSNLKSHPSPWWPPLGFKSPRFQIAEPLGVPGCPCSLCSCAPIPCAPDPCAIRCPLGALRAPGCRSVPLRAAACPMCPCPLCSCSLCPSFAPACLRPLLPQPCLSLCPLPRPLPQPLPCFCCFCPSLWLSLGVCLGVTLRAPGGFWAAP